MSSADLYTAVRLQELPGALDPLVVFDGLRRDPYPWLLDSASARSSACRFSFAGADPYLVLRAWGQRIELECRRPVHPQLEVGASVRQDDPVALARRLMPSRAGACVPGSAPPFVGGAVGYFGYELAGQLEVLELSARDDLGLPDLVLLYVDQLLIFDHDSGQASVATTGFGPSQAAAQAAADELAARFAARCLRAASCGNPFRASVPTPPRDELLAVAPPPETRCFFDERAYVEAVDVILDEIAAGRVYQTNLTHRLDLPCKTDSWHLYQRLRALSPAPFSAYLKLPEVAILSSSPERFLRLDREGRAESRPIKGTRPRGANSKLDAALEAELGASEKERAENLMIVDLVRNDLGRVCETGSIQVPELRAVEKYSSVFQMVSTVTGQLRSERDIFDLFAACFPPGSMTGAPKIAAMKLIDAIEPVRRGVYSGALGYLDLRGGADLSVVIRTILITQAQAHIHVGGGIVADSQPAAEYRETLDKARPLLAALQEDF